MYVAGPSSPAWVVRRRPRDLASANRVLKSSGGLPTSLESRPIPMTSPVQDVRIPKSL